MEYKDLFEMFDDIRAYVRLTPGCQILIDDDPMSRKVGFCTGVNNPCTEHLVFWCIGLSDLKGSIFKDGVTEEIRKSLSDAFRTSEGRLKMVQDLMNDQSPV